MERLFEEVFVEVCAPTLRGIKPSNLFRYQPQNRDKLLEALDFWNRELEPSGLQVRALKECSRTGAFLILVYREEWLRFILGKISVQHFLKKSGDVYKRQCLHIAGCDTPENGVCIGGRICVIYSADDSGRERVRAGRGDDRAFVFLSLIHI